jgi:hypothetical protein
MLPKCYLEIWGEDFIQASRKKSTRSIIGFDLRCELQPLLAFAQRLADLFHRFFFEGAIILSRMANDTLDVTKYLFHLHKIQFI